MGIESVIGSDRITYDYEYAPGSDNWESVSDQPDGEWRTGCIRVKTGGNGSCTIYVYARNRYAKRIKIKVKNKKVT